MPFVRFYEMFEQLAFKRGWTPAAKCSAEEARGYSCTLSGEVLVMRVDYQVGHTKVFLRGDGYEKMHAAVSAFLSRKVVKFQALVRSKFATRRFRHAVKKVC